MPKPQGHRENFRIRSLQEVLNGKDLVHDLHKHDFFFIVVITRGKGLHEIDFVSYPITQRAVFILRPAQVHRLHIKANSTGYLLEFASDFYPSREQQARFNKVSHKNLCQPKPHTFDRLTALLQHMHEEYQQRNTGYEAALRALLELFFITLLRQSTNPEVMQAGSAAYTADRYEAFLHQIETHITTHKKVSEYADLLHLSAYQLNAITREAVGKTASALINEQVVLEARRQLLATDAQVKDIAYHLGYDDPSYFIRFFKKHTGHSPEAFRQHFT